MSEERTLKLSVFLGVGMRLAAKLVAGGYDLPRKVRNATLEELEAVEGIGPAGAARAKARFTQG